MDILKDSVMSSVKLKLFDSYADASFAHIFHCELIDFPISKVNKLNNFRPERLKKTPFDAFPPHDRPRGIDDIKSVKYFQKMESVPPIWIYQKINDQIFLLDGAHRIIAANIEGKKTISAYIIKVS